MSFLKTDMVIPVKTDSWTKMHKSEPLTLQCSKPIPFESVLTDTDPAFDCWTYVLGNTQHS